MGECRVGEGRGRVGPQAFPRSIFLAPALWKAHSGPPISMN